MSEQSDRVDRAVAHMMLHHPYWASLLLHLRRYESDQVPTMATDGSALLWNPSFIHTLTSAEIEAVLIHEVAHCALLHPFRRNGRDSLRFNIACDAAVNALLEADGIALPVGGVEAAELGLTAEEIYDRIKVAKLNMRDLMDAGSLGEGGENKLPATTREDWSKAVASMRGIAPKGIQRYVDEAVEPKRYWRAELALWASSTIRSADSTWTKPSRRYSPAPGRKRDPQTRIALCVDTSGSVDDRLLGVFTSELHAICSVQGIEAYVIACDAAVHAVYSPGDSWSSFPGGGGTDFRPALRKAEELEVDGCIYFTDGAGEYGQESTLPVIWAMSTATRAPWGITIQIEEGL